MKYLFTLLFVSVFPLAQAQVRPQDVSNMLDQMVRENVISAEEAEKAKIRMQTMNKEQWKDINNKAARVAARSPASVPSANKIEEVNNIDLDGQQFKQIQDDIKKIMPEFRR